MELFLTVIIFFLIEILLTKLIIFIIDNCAWWIYTQKLNTKNILKIFLSICVVCTITRFLYVSCDIPIHLVFNFMKGLML